MANDDAWSSGWSQGDNAAQKRKDKPKKQKNDKNTGGTEDTVTGLSGNPYSILSYLPKLHSGGKVKKTGAYRLKKNEVVLTSTQAKAAGIKKGSKKTGSKKSVSKKA